MIKRQSGNITAYIYGTITHYATDPLRYCKGNRFIINIVTTANSEVTLEYTFVDAGTSTNVSIDYMTDNGGRLQIDLSDWARTIAPTTDTSQASTFTLTRGTSVLSVSFITRDGVCPNNIIMPEPEHYPYAIATNSTVILPPAMIYASAKFDPVVFIRALAMEITGEIAPTVQDTIRYQMASGASGSIELAAYRWQPAQVALPSSTTLFYSVTAPNVRWQTVMLEACDDHCLLIWQSRGGTEKRAFFRVRNVKQLTDERTEFVTAGDAYDSRAMAAVSFEAFIENCSRYDYAYYADIITSPYVRCVYTQEDMDIYAQQPTSEQLGVEVTTKNLTVPNSEGAANKTTTFVIELNYRHYGSL